MHVGDGALWLAKVAHNIFKLFASYVAAWYVAKDLLPKLYP